METSHAACVREARAPARRAEVDGGAQDVVEDATEVGLRITSWNQQAQYERLVGEGIPRLYAAMPAVAG